MINVSNEFWELMQERTDFKENAEITLTDGTVLELDESVFTISNNSVTDAAGANSIPLGVAIARSIQIEIMNDDKRFSEYDFFGARIRLYLKFQLSETVEKIEYGYFTVVEPGTYGTTVIITAIDDMHKADEAYSSNLTFPIKASVMLDDICSNCDIPLKTTQFLNADFEIQAKPSSDYSCRQIIGFIAMIACGNARIDRQGYLEILSYNFDFLSEAVDINSTERKEYHILKNFKSGLYIDTDDVIITGLQTEKAVEESETTEEETETESNIVLVGEKGYVLSLENPLFATKEQEALELIGEVLNGAKMRKFEGEHIGYPIAEFMDPAFIVDREDNTYGTILTDINFVFFGFTTLKNSAENAVRNASKYSSSGSKTLIEARKLIQKEKSDREVALQKLAEKLAVSNGLFMTEEVQEDGSTIYYAHDKPTLEESEIVWKFTSQAIGISMDGGETYPYGLTATGEAILEMIYTIGLNADYIKTGRISDKNGYNYIDLDTGAVQLSGSTTIGDKTVKEIADESTDSLRSEVDEKIAQENASREEFEKFVNEYIQEQTGFFRIENGKIFLGKAGSEIVLVHENDKIVFYENNVAIAYWQNRKFHAVNGEFIESITIGDFVRKIETDGSLSLW